MFCVICTLIEGPEFNVIQNLLKTPGNPNGGVGKLPMTPETTNAFAYWLDKKAHWLYPKTRWILGIVKDDPDYKAAWNALKKDKRFNKKGMFLILETY